jgi:hypothetical protein
MISIIQPSAGRDPNNITDALSPSELPLGGGIIRITKIRKIIPVKIVPNIYKGDNIMSDDLTTDEMEDELTDTDDEFDLDEFDLDEIPDEGFDEESDEELDEIPDETEQSPNEEEEDDIDISDLDEEEDFEGLDGE